MTFANAGRLGAAPGKRDELVEHLLSGDFSGFRFDVVGSPLRG